MSVIDALLANNRKHADQGAQKVEEFVAAIQRLIDSKARTE